VGLPATAARIEPKSVLISALTCRRGVFAQILHTPAANQTCHPLVSPSSSQNKPKYLRKGDPRLRKASGTYSRSPEPHKKRYILLTVDFGGRRLLGGRSLTGSCR
jgi:hypothetical protein